MNQKGFSSSLILLTITLALVILGGVVIFSVKQPPEKTDSLVPTLPRKVTKQATTTATVAPLPTLSSSDEVEALETDLKSTQTDPLEQELNSLNSEISGL